MTRLQKVIIIIYLIVFAVAVAYVPWECYYKVIYLNSYGGVFIRQRRYITRLLFLLEDSITRE